MEEEEDVSSTRTLNPSLYHRANVVYAGNSCSAARVVSVHGVVRSPSSVLASAIVMASVSILVARVPRPATLATYTAYAL